MTRLIKLPLKIVMGNTDPFWADQEWDIVDANGNVIATCANRKHAKAIVRAVNAQKRTTK
jgi:hypothetical protein